MTLLRGQFAAKMAKTVGQCGTTHDCGSRIRIGCHLLIVPARHDFIEEFSPPHKELPNRTRMNTDETDLHGSERKIVNKVFLIFSLSYPCKSVQSVFIRVLFFLP